MLGLLERPLLLTPEINILDVVLTFLKSCIESNSENVQESRLNLLPSYFQLSRLLLTVSGK